MGLRIKEPGRHEFGHVIGRHRPIGDALARCILDFDERLEPDHAARADPLQLDLDAARRCRRLQRDDRLIDPQGFGRRIT